MTTRKTWLFQLVLVLSTSGTRTRTRNTFVEHEYHFISTRTIGCQIVQLQNVRGALIYDGQSLSMARLIARLADSHHSESIVA